MRQFYIHRKWSKYIIYNPVNHNIGWVAIKIKDDKVLFTDFSPNGPIRNEKGLGSNSELAVIDDVVERLGPDYMVGHPSPTADRIRHLKKFGAKGGTWLNLFFMVYENIASYRKKLRDYVDSRSGIEMVWRKPPESRRVYTVMAERAEQAKAWAERHCPV